VFLAKRPLRFVHTLRCLRLLAVVHVLYAHMVVIMILYMHQLGVLAVFFVLIVHLDIVVTVVLEDRLQWHFFVGDGDWKVFLLPIAWI